MGLPRDARNRHPGIDDGNNIEAYFRRLSTKNHFGCF
jgi:hypothetical protein